MLRGSRVILRAVTPEDIETQHQFENDVELYLLDGSVPQPRSSQQVQADFESMIKGGDAIVFAIEADGEYIGNCELAEFNSTNQTCKLGISIGNRNYWGRGYGRDAVKLLLDYGFRYRNVRKVGLGVAANNERAIRCYRGCGFVEEGQLRQEIWINGEYIDRILMGILRSEWEAGNHSVT